MEKGQLTWTQLPQDFKNLATVFGTALASDLKAFSADQLGCILLQYIDDLLLAGPTREDCMGKCIPSFSFMGGRIQILYEKGPDLPKHCQIPQL
jgi:hypothetical protein